LPLVILQTLIPSPSSSFERAKIVLINSRGILSNAFSDFGLVGRSEKEKKNGEKKLEKESG